MRLSTSVNMYSVRWDANIPALMIRGVDALKDAGFDALDFSINAPLALTEDEQEKWICAVNDRMAARNIHANQGHAFLTDTRLLDTEEKRVAYKAKVERSLMIGGALNIPWMVVHPVCHVDLPFAKSVENNLAFFRSLEDVMEKARVRVAIENLPRCEYHSAEALLTLLDRLDNPAFGLCWDTGHAFLSGEDQPSAIMMMADKLKCTHVHDNHGQEDEHLFPMMGDIIWQPITRALMRSGYAGDFTYETAQPVKRLPNDDVLRGHMLAYAVTLGRYLIAMGEEEGS